MKTISILAAITLICSLILSGANAVQSVAMIGVLYALCAGFYMFCKKVALYEFFADQ